MLNPEKLERDTSLEIDTSSGEKTKNLPETSQEIIPISEKTSESVKEVLSPEIQKHLKEFSRLLEEDETYEAKEYADTYLQENSEKVLDIIKQELIDTLEIGWDRAMIIKDEFLAGNEKFLKSPEVLEAARNGIIFIFKENDIGERDFSVIREIKEEFLKDNPEMYLDIATKEIISCLEAEEISEAKIIKEELLEDNPELFLEAVKEGLIFWLEGAYIDVVKIIEEELLEDNPELFLEAVKEGFISCLKSGFSDQAKIIEEELLEDNPELFLEAMNEGLISCLEKRYKDEVKEREEELLEDSLESVYNGCLCSLKYWNNVIEPLYSAKNIAGISALNQENWVLAFALYAATELEEESEHFSEKTKKHLTSLFQDPENKKFVLHSLKKLYEKILKNEEIPNEEKILLDVIYEIGVGTLTVSESVANFLYVIQGKKLFYEPLLQIKKHFESKKMNVSDQDFGQWCALSTPFIETFPEIFQEYLPVFLKMNDKDFSLYLEEVFPLHNVLCLLAENIGDGAEIFFQEYIDRMKDTLNIEEEHKKIFSYIKENLQKSFGLKKIPESFDAEMIRSVKNFSMYFANLHDKYEDKETYLGLFFALHLHNKWNDFLVGNMSYDEVCEYIEDDKNFIKDYMENREKNISLFQEFSLEERQKFHIPKIFQGYADISTIDTKFSSIEIDIKRLLDTDMYSEEEKILLSLLQKHEKNFGNVLAKLWQKKGGKNISFSKEEKEIITEIKKHLKIETKEDIKKIQDDLSSSFANKIINLQHKVQDIFKKQNIPEKLKNLKQAKTPSEEIMAIFIKCGVAFKTDSGAQAISSDIEYLRTVLSTTRKQKDMLTEEEKEKGEKYLKGIETQVKDLEALLKTIIESLENYKKQIPFLQKDELTDKEKSKKTGYEEFMKKLEQKGGETLMYTTMTSNMNEVIPRIRACLSCRNIECNNDTNLSFGDGHRFFLFTGLGGKEDCSDQIVNILPTTEKEHYFVFDTLYGKERSADILSLHIATVLEKSQETGLPVFLPKTVLIGDIKTLLEKIEKHTEGKIQHTETTLSLNLPTSSGADFYQEFVEDTRDSGEKAVEGYVIKL